MKARLIRAAVFLITFLVTAGFDQGTKEWARDTLPAGSARPVIDGFWEWELARNEGAAFSLGAGHEVVSRVALPLVATVLLLAIVVIALRTRPDQRLHRVALALIAGGAAGNLIDRVRDGAVTDFIRWRWHEHAWPIFNVADVALAIGALLLIAGAVRDARRPPAPA